MAPLRRPLLKPPASAAVRRGLAGAPSATAGKALRYTVAMNHRGTQRSAWWGAVAALLLMLPVAMAAAQDYEAGARAYRAGTYEAAIAQWQPLAQAGHARAQFALALAFEQGRGVARSAAEAARWYERAAASGLADAQYNLGNLHVDGRGVTRSAARAVALFRAAAEQGHVPAQINLAWSYEQGAGVAEDREVAAAWYARAAMAGSREAGERFAALREAGVRPAALAALPRPDEVIREPPGAAAGEDAGPARAPREAAVPVDAPRRAEPTLRGRPRIRLASYRESANAERGWQAISRRHAEVLAGHGHVIDPVDLGAERGRFLRLEVGPFASMAAARAACARIMETGDDCLPVGPED